MYRKPNFDLIHTPNEFKILSDLIPKIVEKYMTWDLDILNASWVRFPKKTSTENRVAELFPTENSFNHL